MTDKDLKFQKDFNIASLAPAERAQLVKAGRLCFKCKLRAPNYCNKQDKVCQPCFMDSVVHRFKSSLRTNLKIWKDDLNLICVSGGSASMALLDLMHNALFGDAESEAKGTVKISQRKMFFKVHVLHIDEGPAVYGWSQEFHQ